MQRALRLAGAFVSLAICLPAASAQSNVIPGTDVELGIIGTGTGTGSASPARWGRSGAFPNGTISVSAATTSCNVGSVDVPWISTDSGNPMGDDHPYIATLFARESGGRLVQISNYADVKHGFFALSNEQCGGNCNQGPFGNGTLLGQGCSDTYGVFNNADQYWLAPADEIDPWLGLWDPFGSHFDTGEPDVGPPNNNNGLRSLTNSQVSNFDALNHRVQIRDEELDVQGAVFYYQGYYVIRGEPEANRDNNFRSRRVNVSFTSDWNFSDSGEIQLGSILQQWDGASITTAANGNDDGRIYVAAKVTGPVDGLYHYEYAIQNRDVSRDVGSFRLPLCAEATVTNVGFRDIDTDGGNDWSVVQTSSELVFSTTDNPIRWNSFYNVWFDSDAAPELGDASYEPFSAGPGASLVTIGGTQVPTGQYSYQYGDGCSFTTPPAVYANGQATIGNAAFSATITGNDAGAAVLPLAGFVDGTLPLGPGCNLYMLGLIQVLPIATADGSGNADIALPIPALPSLEGVEFTLQGASQRAAGPLEGTWDLTDALRIRVGDTTAGCP